MKPTYQARASVIVSTSVSDIELEPRYKTLTEEDLAVWTFLEERRKALTELATNNTIALKVLSELGNILEPQERHPEDLVEMVKTKQEGDLISILVEAGSPEKAMAIANAWAEAFVDHVNSLFGASQPASEFQVQADEALADYQESEAVLSAFLGNNQIAALSNEIGAKEGTLADYYAAQRSLDRLLSDAKALRDDLEEGLDSSNVGRNGLALLLLRAQASTLSSGMPADLQLTLDQQTEGAEDPARQLAELDTLIANLETRQLDVRVLIDDGTLQREILELRAQLEQENARERELNNARNLAWDRYVVVSAKVGEAQVANQAPGSWVRLAEAAIEPKEPISPRKALNTLLGSVVGCMLAVGVAFTMEYMDDSIETPEDVQRALGLSTLSSIAPVPASATCGPVAASQPSSATAEGFRHLRTQLEVAAGGPPRAILVTSANPMEGKSTVLANLGTVIAQAGRSVIIVDSDMRRPVLHETFGLSNAQGLSNALVEDGGNPRLFLQETTVENLRVLTSGPLPPNPAELLDAPRLEELVHRLRTDADILLFDSPACLAVTDALLLARTADATLLVVESGRTPRDTAHRAVQALTGVGAKVVGVVLNRSRLGAEAAYYYQHVAERDRRNASESRQPFGLRLWKNMSRWMKWR